MIMIIKAGLAGIWLIVVPILVGTFFAERKENGTIAECLVKGYLILFFFMEIITLPMIYFDISFHFLSWTYGGILILIALAAIFYGNMKIFFPVKKLKLSKDMFFLIMAVGVILFQICIVIRYAHMDADDAMFVGAATTAVYTDKIFSISPYTGFEYAKIESRYILSPFPIFLAVLSQLSGGLHPAIMAHTIFPPVFLFVAYSVIFLLAQRWFRKQPESQGVFVLCVAVLNWFSAYSTYNTGMFQMIRLWQGKALLASALLPLTYYLTEPLLSGEKLTGKKWFVLMAANMSCCLVSSMGIILSPIMMGSIFVITFLKNKSVKDFVKNITCCVPSMILGIIYIMIR